MAEASELWQVRARVEVAGLGRVGKTGSECGRGQQDTVGPGRW